MSEKEAARRKKQLTFCSVTQLTDQITLLGRKESECLPADIISSCFCPLHKEGVDMLLLNW